MSPELPAEDSGLRAELRAVAEERLHSLGSHPSPEELVDYQLGALAVEDADRIQEHLSLCRECAQVVLDLAAIARPVEGEGAAGADIESEWNRLEAQLRSAARPTESRPAGTGKLPWLLLAASLLATIGLLTWGLGVRRDLDRAREPRADAVMADLVPVDKDTERSAEAPRRVRLQPGQGRVLLLLNLGDLREFPHYRIELLASARNAGGRKVKVWGTTAVRQREDGSFLLDLPADSLAARTYEVRLHGRGAGREVLLATYSFEVVRAEAPRKRK